MRNDIDQLLHRNLDAGERVLWLGTPRSGIRFTVGDWALIPFSLFWSGVVFSGAIAAWKDPEADMPVIVLVPFLVIGLHLTVGRFVVDAWMRARTMYALTERRMVMVNAYYGVTVTSLLLRHVAEVSLTEGHRGRGTVTLKTSSKDDGRELDSILEPREVYDLIRRTLMTIP